MDLKLRDTPIGLRKKKKKKTILLHETQCLEESNKENDRNSVNDLLIKYQCWVNGSLPLTHTTYTCMVFRTITS